MTLRLPLLALLVCVSFSATAQFTGHWTRYHDIPDKAGLDGYIHDIAMDDDGNLFVYGGTWFDSLFILKYSPEGNLLWENNYLVSGSVPMGRSSCLPPLATLSDGDVVFTGNDVSVYFNQVLNRVDASGTLLWQVSVPLLVGGVAEYGQGVYSDDADNIVFHVSGRRIMRFTSAGSTVYDISPPVEYRYDYSIAVAGSGDVYASRFDIDTLPGGATEMYYAIDHISPAGTVTSLPIPYDTTIVDRIAVNDEGYLAVVFSRYFPGGYEFTMKTYRPDLTPVGTLSLPSTYTTLRGLKGGPDGSFYVMMDNSQGMLRVDSLASVIWDVAFLPPTLEYSFDGEFFLDSDGDPYVRSRFFAPVGSPSFGYERESVVRIDKNTGMVTEEAVIIENSPFSVGLQHFTGNGDAFYDIMEDYDDFYLMTRFCTSGCPTNATGLVWRDPDADCALDPLEIPWPGLVVETMPHHFVTTVDTSGSYSLSLFPDTHTVDLILPPYRYVSCAGAPYDIIVTPSSTHTGLDFGVVNHPGITDMVALLAGWAARPGFEQTLYAQGTNIGTLPATGRLRLEYDPLFSYVSAVPAPDSVLPGALVWNYTTLMEFNHVAPDVQLSLPPSVPIGTPYAHVLRAITTLPDTTPANNADTLAALVMGSYDPNAKYFKDRGPIASLGTETDSTLWFEIYFQNTGTDTAFTVIVKDTLEADLDWAHMTTWITSHPATFSLTGMGYAQWRFDNILLPDSNTNEPASHGYILFSVPVRKPITMGKTITNRASIYFDFNAPVLTNTAIGTYDGLTAVAPHEGAAWQVFPNPFTQELRIRGTEDATCQLVDLSGKVLRQVQLRLASGEDVMETGDLPAGIYFLRLSAADGATATVKLIRAQD